MINANENVSQTKSVALRRSDDLVRRAVKRGYVQDFRAAHMLWRGGIRSVLRMHADDPKLRADPLELSYPQLYRNLSTKTDENEDFWSPSFLPTLLTENIFNSAQKRRDTAEYFFEVIGTRAFQIQCTAPLSLYASGATSGCVLECGAGTTSAVPVFEGYQQLKYARRIERGGIDLNRRVAEALASQGYAVRGERVSKLEELKEEGDGIVWRGDFEDVEGRRRSASSKVSEAKVKELKRTRARTSSSTKSLGEESALGPDVIAAIKKAECFVAPSATAFQQIIDGEGHGTRIGKAMKKLVALPDGATVALKGSVCAGIAEKMLFENLEDASRPKTSVQTLVNSATLGCCDADGSVPRMIDIFLAGGTTLMRGFQQRLANELARPELKAQRESSAALRIGYAGRGRSDGRHAPEDAALQGGSVLASMSSFGEMWIGKSQWEEEGARVLLRKCL
eukprot:g914.t1